MKININFLLFISVIIIGGLITKSCSKDDNETYDIVSGKVIAYVADKCGCCPGWHVEYSGDTIKFENVPDNDHLQDLVNFYGYPISIDFTFKNDTSSCSDFYKIMTSIEFNLDYNCTNSGIILGYNSTQCACCPGWKIKTDYDTIKVLRLPIESQVREIVEKSGFPISIEFDYINEVGTCDKTYKEITCIRLIES